MWCRAVFLAVAAPALVAANPEGCECTGVNTGIDTTTYGADYGTSCAAWEDGRNPGASCDGAHHVGTFCCRPWCYVDPATCDGAVTPYFATYVASLTEYVQNLYFSYVACDSTTKSDFPDAVTWNYQTEECPYFGRGPSVYTPPVRITIQLRDKRVGDSFLEAPGCHAHCDLGSDICQGGSPNFPNCLSNICCSVRPGCIANELDGTGKPSLSAHGLNTSSSDCFGFTSQEHFHTWFSGSPSAVTWLEFSHDPLTDLYTFDSNDFLPLGDGNGLFTTEMSVYFRYNGGEMFTFRGDDDVWVFIDNRLAVDIGGCHAAVERSIALDTFDLTIGKNYMLQLFHAERCYGASNFLATMNLRQDQGVCPNSCHAAEEQGNCNLASGECECYPGWQSVDCGTPVDSVCPNSCHAAEEQGNCNLASGECECYTGWRSVDCGTRVDAAFASTANSANSANSARGSGLSHVVWLCGFLTMRFGAS